MKSEKMDNLLVDVRQRYKSSTRIDGQLDDSKVFIDNFILHGTAINVLETISRDFEGSEQRAYSITGPYGSGKSTIALFLSLLLSTNKDERDYAEDSLDCAEGLKSEFPNRFKIKKGWKVVKHVCAMESPAHALLRSIASSYKGKLSNEELKKLTDNECLDAIKELLNAKSVKEDGVLILLDEMGKALDYCSSGNKDLYIFQQLADIAQQSNNQIILIGFLHQSFTEYAKNKDSKLQEDWAKVQGRYRDLGYNPSVDESLFLLGDAISKSSDDIDKRLTKQHKKSIEVVNNSFKSKTRNTSDLFKTLPLDPLVSLLLGPISRRRFSQNERSLFGFLASYEKYAFREFLNSSYGQDSKLDKLYSTDDLWDYLHHNLYHIIVTSPDSKPWLESCDAIDRATKRGGNLHSSITKVISLLTLFGFNQHFHATKNFILNYFECKGYKKSEIESSLTDLEKWTVIIFRSAHNGYFIFEGSDIDINSLIKNQKEKLESGIDWTSVCDVSTSILATSHYHQTGTMRWANKLIINTVDKELLDKLNIQPVHGKSFLNFVIPTNDTALSQLSKLASDNKYMVVGKTQSLSKLKDIAIELIALEKARKEEDIVIRDKIALRELDSRIVSFKQTLSNELERVFASSTWSYQHKKLSNQPLSSVASLVANVIFSKAPKIINELINKAKPSGSANAGIRKLLKAMSEYADKPGLNLPEKTFPAEKGLYFSSLANFGLHIQNNEGGYKFDMPSNDKPELKELFEASLDYISDSSGIIRVSELVDLWSKEPYGLAKGVIPIWLLALLQANNHQLAFYDFNGVTSKSTFIDGADEEFAMKILQQPELIGIQYVKIDHSTTNYLNEIAEPFKNDIDEVSPLAIAQALVVFYSKLSPWTRNTRTLSKELLKFKDETKVASDPNDYLLNKLPKVFGKNKFIDDIKSIDIRSIKEQLEKAHEKELLKFESRIREYITFSGSLVKNCKKVAAFTTNPKVETFALRLSEFSSNNKWVSAIISLLSGKAERNWDDHAVSKANSELIGIITRFKHDLLLSDFGDIEYKAVNRKYQGELKSVSNSISKLDKAEKQAVLLTILEDLMEA
jgi:energy-coupling factor transporter ATP-binding protein EcfA2